MRALASTIVVALGLSACVAPPEPPVTAYATRTGNLRPAGVIDRFEVRRRQAR